MPLEAIHGRGAFALTMRVAPTAIASSKAGPPMLLSGRALGVAASGLRARGGLTSAGRATSDLRAVSAGHGAPDLRAVSAGHGAPDLRVVSAGRGARNPRVVSAGRGASNPRVVSAGRGASCLRAVSVDGLGSFREEGRKGLSTRVELPRDLWSGRRPHPEALLPLADLVPSPSSRAALADAEILASVDAVVVLGGGLPPGGEVPPVAQRRLALAALVRQLCLDARKIKAQHDQGGNGRDRGGGEGGRGHGHEPGHGPAPTEESAPKPKHAVSSGSAALRASSPADYCCSPVPSSWLPAVPIVISGGGSPHNPASLDGRGGVLHEADAYAAWALEHSSAIQSWIQQLSSSSPSSPFSSPPHAHAPATSAAALDRAVLPEAILTETSSYDTVGNAYFSLTQHVLPAKWRHVVLVTSSFHMHRAEVIFRDLFGRLGGGVALTPVSASDRGLFQPQALAARIRKEKRAAETYLIDAQALPTLAHAHAWLFATHLCYAVRRLEERETMPVNIEPETSATY